MAMFSMANGTPELPGNLMEAVNAELAQGEPILWLAQPKPGRFARQAIPAVVFGIPWTAFAIFWTVAASGFRVPDFTTNSSLFQALVGIPFVLIGLALLSSPLWAMRRAKRTAYLITDRRAIIVEGGRSTKARSYAPSELGDIERRERPDGSGDIIIQRRVWYEGRGDTATPEAGFFGIANVRETEKLLRDVVEAHRGRPQA